MSNRTDHTVSHWTTTTGGARYNPDHVICERCGNSFDLKLETLLQHFCSMYTVEMMHRLPASEISNPPVSLPLVNNEIALLYSIPPSKIPKVEIQSDGDVIGDSPPGGDGVSLTCKVCGLAVDLVLIESYTLGVDVFCNGTCKTVEDSRVSARQTGPAVVALTEQNREQAKQTALDLGARLGQL